MSSVDFSFWNDWDSFVFWEHKNWRDFTLINISVETGTNRYFMFHICVLGFHFWCQRLEEQ